MPIFNDVNHFRKGYVSDGGRMRKRCRKDGSWGGRDGQCQLPVCHALDQLPPEVVVEPPSCAQVNKVLNLNKLVKTIFGWKYGARKYTGVSKKEVLMLVGFLTKST